jgi:indolepyruvate ferredoxin oxidoreductase alpha subunit
VRVIDPMADEEALEEVIRDSLESGQLAVIVTRRPCILASGKIKKYERAIAEKRAAECAGCATE